MVPKLHNSMDVEVVALTGWPTGRPKCRVGENLLIGPDHLTQTAATTVTKLI